MTPGGVKGAGRGAGPSIIKFEDFEVSWCGPTPFPGLCVFGANDGRLKFANVEGRNESSAVPMLDSGDSINGVAIIKPHYFGISSRSAVSVIQSDMARGPTNERSLFHGGAHGIVATASGRFVAPLGPGGFLTLTPTSSNIQIFKIVKPKVFINCYKVAPLSASRGVDVLACALRRDGLGTSTIGETERSFRTRTLPGLDIVDVCGLGSAGWPLAAAALGIDGTVLLSRDVLSDAKLLGLRFETIIGRGYRLIAIDGHLILLTSEVLYVFRGLAAHFLSRGLVEGPISVNSFPIHAVDINAAGQGRLFVILPDSVHVYSIDQLASDLGASASGRSRPAGSGMVTASAVDFGAGWEQIVDRELTFAAVG